MNWEKGFKRLVWVLSVVIGLSVILYLLFFEVSARDPLAALLFGLPFFGLCGFGGTWLAYYFIRWIACPSVKWIIKGFKSDVPDRKDEPK
jgi:phage shock protein PspC (stress-responsive transcriptional regulator)